MTTNPSFIEAKKAELAHLLDLATDTGKWGDVEAFPESFLSEIEGRVVPELHERDGVNAYCDDRDEGHNRCRAEVKAAFQHLRTGVTE